MNTMVQYISERLHPYYSESEALELALWVAEEISGHDRTHLILESDCKDIKNISYLEKIISRLIKKEPIQYILGYTDWMGLHLKLNQHTLIPRPETAELVEWICSMDWDNKINRERPIRVLDLCTGCGCIALALKHRHPNWDICGVDIQEECIAIACENSKNLNLSIEWKVGNVLSTNILDILPDEVDIIVSNPPYVRECEKKEMSVNVLAYEPHLSLFVSDADPLIFYASIARLYKSNHLFFEINEHLHNETHQLLTSLGYTDIQTKKDIFTKNRMLYGCLKK